MKVMLSLLESYRPAASFTTGELSEKTIYHLIEQARLAPSANNVQPWRFIIHRQAKTIAAVAEAINSPKLSEAAVLLMVTAKEGFFSNRWKQQPFALIDVPIACSHILLAAHDRNIGSRVIYDFPQKAVLNLIELEKKSLLVALLFLGQADEYEEAADIDSVELFGNLLASS